MISYFYVHSKADRTQLNLPHETKKQIYSEETSGQESVESVLREKEEAMAVRICETGRF